MTAGAKFSWGAGWLAVTGSGRVMEVSEPTGRARAELSRTGVGGVIYRGGGCAQEGLKRETKDLLQSPAP